MEPLRFKKIYLEITNVCNLRCPFCPPGRRPPAFMGREEYLRALEQLRPYTQYLYFHVKGEPLLHPLLPEFLALAGERGLEFGLKLSNTFPVEVKNKELPAEEMYMAGKSLFPLTIEMARRVSRDFDGRLRLSYSGGADYFNIDRLFQCGVWPVTMATTALKPGGYQRFTQIAEKLEALPFAPFTRVDTAGVEALALAARRDPLHVKAVKPLPRRKLAESYGRLCALLSNQGVTVVCCTISMFHSVRAWNRANIPGYYEVYLEASMDTLRRRDQKGLYSRNADNVAGVGLQVELPDTADLILDNNGQSTPEEQVALLCWAAKEGV